ncbi:MAG: tetratricopeptide repeat protein [Promethearchaeota archaeon]
MNPVNLTIQDLINENKKLTFLVGAGCSIDPPSCLPAGREMIKAIINYTCAESERQKILELKELRFEQLVEFVRNRLDPELKIIDYYGQCDAPNLQHFFLADMIKKGQFVMTTNFDFLIEYALLQSKVLKDEIIPVITKIDFEEFKNPMKLFEKGKKTLYKIHGSTKNIITELETRDSLVATIQAFGSGKEGENIFQVEPFKRPLFDNISNNRTLIIIGYSGSDDFDIVPTLMVLKNLKNIVWINYISDDESTEKIYEINESIGQDSRKLDKVTQILVDIYRMHNADHVYRVDANTTTLIKELFDSKQNGGSNGAPINPITWFKNNITPPDEFDEFSIPHEIYHSFDMYQDEMKCLEKILLLSDKKKNLVWKAIAFNDFGMIYDALGNYAKALKRFEEALKINEQLGNLSGKAANLSNIGLIYQAQGNYPEALKRFEEALRIFEQLGNLSGKAANLSNIGLIYQAEGNYPKALQRYEGAMRIDEKLGNLSGKATDLINIGLIYKAQGNYPEALKRFEEALRIFEQLGNISGKATNLSNIGLIFQTQGNYSEALQRFEEALRIDEQLGDLSGKTANLTNIGLIYQEQGNYSEALQRFEEALRIDEQLGDLSGKTADLNNIGLIYQAEENYPEALQRFEEALRINEQLGNLSGKATDLNNIGMNYHAQRNYREALKWYEEALRIIEQVGDLSRNAVILNNIGAIYDALGKYPNALKRYKKALDILRNLGLIESHNAKTLKQNIEMIKSKMK